MEAAAVPEVTWMTAAVTAQANLPEAAQLQPVAPQFMQSLLVVLNQIATAGVAVQQI